MKKNKNQIINVLKKAKKEHFVVPQFNFCNLVQLKAIFEAAKKFKRPFILGTSEKESQYLGLNLAVAMKKDAEGKIGFPIFLNLDHGKSFNYIKKAIDAGYDMVHFDGCGIEIRKNISIVKKIVAYGRKKNVAVEGEIGYVSKSSGIHRGSPKIKPEDMTKPKEVEKFIKETRVDALAIAIGNIHGIFTETKNPKLDLKRLSLIKESVEKVSKPLSLKTSLVLHGGSGISSKQIKESIERGIVKININTEIRSAWRKGMEKTFKKNKKDIAPYKLMPLVIKEMEKVVDKKLKLFHFASAKPI